MSILSCMAMNLNINCSWFFFLLFFFLSMFKVAFMYLSFVFCFFFLLVYFVWKLSLEASSSGWMGECVWVVRSQVLVNVSIKKRFTLCEFSLYKGYWNFVPCSSWSSYIFLLPCLLESNCGGPTQNVRPWIKFVTASCHVR